MDKSETAKKSSSKKKATKAQKFDAVIGTQNT
jgi:hypothetical protein